jgi:beta-glucosidase
VLYAWFPGTEGGAAIADALYGDVDPSGRLPMTFPRSVGQIPIYYAHLPTGRPASADQYSSKYLDERNDPLYPFGYGLSYGHFTYSDLKVDGEKAGRITGTVTLANDGPRPGTETVQVYAHRNVSDLSQPVRQLVAFRKVTLAPGESRRIDLSFPADRLELPGGQHPSAQYRLWVGGSSQATLAADFVLSRSFAD